MSVNRLNRDGYDYAVKVRTMNVADHDDFQMLNTPNGTKDNR